ncbi:hypothetical protein KCU79_g63, partial [Aureobasidium melanogenum]
MKVTLSGYLKVLSTHAIASIAEIDPVASTTAEKACKSIRRQEGETDFGQDELLNLFVDLGASLDEGKVLAVEVFESVLVLTLCARLTAELASCADGKGLVVQDVTIHHDSDFKSRRGVAVGSNLSMSLERLVSTAREWSRQGLENDYLIVVLLRAHA